MAPSKAFEGGAGGFAVVFFDGSGGACVERWCHETYRLPDGHVETPSTQLKFRNHTESRTWGGFDTLPVPAYWRVAASTSSLDIVVVSTTLHFDMNLE